MGALENMSVDRQTSEYDAEIATLIDELIELQAKLYDEKDHIAKEALKNHTKQLKIVMENFNDPSKMKHYIIKKNERIESDIAYQEIYSSADHSIIILDDYINVKTLGTLKVCHDNIKVFIFFSKYHGQYIIENSLVH